MHWGKHGTSIVLYALLAGNHSEMGYSTWKGTNHTVWKISTNSSAQYAKHVASELRQETDMLKLSNHRGMKLASTALFAMSI